MIFISQIRKLGPRLLLFLMTASLLKPKRMNCINHCSNVLPLELRDKVPAAEDTDTARAAESLEGSQSLHFQNKNLEKHCKNAGCKARYRIV